MMNRKFVKQFIFVIIFSAIPAFLSYLANSTLIFDKLIALGLLGETLDVPLIQDYCLWIGIIFSAVALSFDLFVTKVKYNHILEQRNLLIKMTKNILASSLGKRFISQASSFDIRIFVPKYPTLYKLLEKLGYEKYHKKFTIKNIDLISDEGITKNLEFEVYPNKEGLVGMCYETKYMVYNDDLEHTNDTMYQLNTNQINRTSNLKWSICCPVCNDSNNIVAIVALDGKTKITLDKEKETALQKEMSAFCYMLYDSVPQLFKRR